MRIRIEAGGEGASDFRVWLGDTEISHEISAVRFRADANMGDIPELELTIPLLRRDNTLGPDIKAAFPTATD